MKFGFIFLFTGIFLGVSAADFGPISIEQKPSLTREMPVGGYGSMEFRLQNRDRSNPAEVYLEMRGNYGVPRRASRRFLLPPGGTAETVLYWPNSGGRQRWRGSLVGGSIDDIRLIVNGGEYPNHFTGRHSVYYQNYHLCSQVLAAQSELFYFFERFEQNYSASRGTSDLPLESWPLRLRDYAGIQQIWLDSSETLSAELKSVLDSWVAGGGMLITLVGPESPWPEQTGDKDQWFMRHSGFGRYIVCRPVSSGGEGKMKRLNDFGSRMLYGEEKEERDQIIKELGGAPFLRRELELARSDAWNSQWDKERLDKLLALPVKTVSTRMLFAVMLVFVILIGPVNYFVLRRKKRTVWLLVTMPVISLAFCLGVVGYITVEEGWQSYARLTGITFLDQTSHQAATRVVGGVYSPLAYRKTLDFAGDDLLAFIDDTGPMELRLDRGQRISSGVIRPRVPFYFTLARCDERLEQLRIGEMTAQSVTLINGLGAGIEEMLLIDAEGRAFHSAAPVEAGARAELKATGSRKRVHANLLQGLRWSFPGFVEPLDWTTVRNSLPPGHYAALLSGSAFYSPVVTADDRKTRHLVIGKFQ